MREVIRILDAVYGSDSVYGLQLDPCPVSGSYKFKLANGVEGYVNIHSDNIVETDDGLPR